VTAAGPPGYQLTANSYQLSVLNTEIPQKTTLRQNAGGFFVRGR
jgi:hypothetical protein